MRANWKTFPISELYEGLFDGPHATPKPTDAGPVFLGIKNVTDDGHLDLSDIRHIAEEDFARWTRRVEPRPGDIVFTYEATLNRYAIIPEGFRGCLGRRMALIRTDPKKVDGGFLFYYFFAPAWREVIKKNMMTGATVDRIPLITFPNFPVSVPPLPLQRRIAGILSAYDELMENSRRRIRILEAMARALYREWFVHYRFPGHENLPRVASPLGDIPKGWEVLEFRHLFDIRYGKTLPKTEISKSGPYPVYGAGDVIGFYDKMLCPAKCALVTSRGNGSGTVWRTREAAFVTNNSLIMLPQKDRQFWDYSFVELLLMHANVIEAKTGSAQPQVTIENLNYVKAIVPARQLVEKFCAIATPIYEQVDLLFRQIQNLRRTRDLLLPRLLSGQLLLTTKEPDARS